MVSESESGVRPWSLAPKRLGLRALVALGAGSLIGAFYIGTADIKIASQMGAQYRFQLWWTYFVLAVAGWAMIDMSVRYYLSTGRTPMSAFKEVHPGLSIYLFVAVVVCTIIGSGGQWNACAMVVSGLAPGVPLEVGGGLSALLAALVLTFGRYSRLEKLCVAGLIALIVCFFASAVLARVPWAEALGGLVPRRPTGDPDVWKGLFRANAGSMINAWLILIYPYTMMEKGWRGKTLQERVDTLHQVRLDYAWGILAAAVVALPIMAAASTLHPFGIVPKNPMDFGMLLQPLAGSWSKDLFLVGLYLAAWTSGVAWWICGAYALADLLNLPIKMGSKHVTTAVWLFLPASVAIVFLRFDPATLIILFAGFLSTVFPVIAVGLWWRVSRGDVGYFRAWRGKWVLFAAEAFAVVTSVYVGWVLFESQILPKLGT